MAGESEPSLGQANSEFWWFQLTRIAPDGQAAYFALRKISDGHHETGARGAE